MGPLPSYAVTVILRPGRAFQSLMEDPRRLRIGAQALAIFAALYTLIYVFLYQGGAHPTTFKPWLAIPAEEYYRYNRFLLAPSVLMGWVLAAGIGQLLGRLFGGSGSFEDTLSALGLAIGVASVPGVLHDLTVSFLGATHIIDAMEHEHAMNAPTPWRTALWIFYSMYAVAFLILFPKAIGASQRLRAIRAATVGVIAFVVYQLFFLLFNR